MTRTSWLIMVAVLGLGCGSREAETTTLVRYPCDDLRDMISTDQVIFDPNVSLDGKGSFRIDATGTHTYNLFEIDRPAVDSTRLIVRAHVRTKNLTGQTFLEILCRFPTVGEFFGRGMDHPVRGTTDWQTIETSFNLRPGESPDRIRLNIVVEGRGTIWIDDVEVLQAPPIM